MLWSLPVVWKQRRQLKNGSRGGKSTGFKVSGLESATHSCPRQQKKFSVCEFSSRVLQVRRGTGRLYAAVQSFEVQEVQCFKGATVDLIQLQP